MIEEVEGGASGDERLASILESVLFASGEPITLKRLVEVLDGPTPAEVRAALGVLAGRLDSSAHGVRLVEVAGGYQLRTARENAEWVRSVFRDKPRRLGRAALETLAVIAYRQPVTRAEIEGIRGVDIEAVLSTLLQRNVVAVVGRKEAVGRPLLYGTTSAFLELFGFRDLSELPVLKELPDPAAAATGATPEEGKEVGADEARATSAETECQELAGGPVAAAEARSPESGGSGLEGETEPGAADAGSLSVSEVEAAGEGRGGGEAAADVAGPRGDDLSGSDSGSAAGDGRDPEA